MPLLLLTAITLPFFVAPFFPWLLHRSKQALGFISCSVALTGFILLSLIWKYLDIENPLIVSIPFAPTLHINAVFLVDGLSLFFGLLVTSVGALVNFYAQYYMNLEDRYLGRFYAYLNFFTGSMLGCVFSDNLIFLFLFWELTAIASFFLITYSFKKEDVLLSGRMVFLITSLTGLALLIGILMIGILDNTFLWSEFIRKQTDYSGHSLWRGAIVLCFLIGIFGKSAQVPFHFWLPNAMCAPTPVSAYLHAATMVKLGIYLTARMYPLFVLSALWFPLVTTICFSTMLIGAILSLISNDLKQILAYATVSQLGFFIGFYGIGDVEGVSYDFVHILNHAFYKGSLFMLVGIIDRCTGIRDIRYIGGLIKKIPLTTVIFFIATAAMAGIPGTTGFLSKELIINDLLNRTGPSGPVILLVLITASIFKVAFSIRLFYHLFIRELPVSQSKIKKPQWQLLVSPAILSLLALIFGIWPQGLQWLAESFYVSGLHVADPRMLKVWHGITGELLLSLLIFGVGTILFLSAEKSRIWWQKHPIFDFGHVFNRGIDYLVSGSGQLTCFLTGKSASRHLATLLLSFSFLCTVPLLSSLPVSFHFGWEDLLRLPTFLLIFATTIAVVILRDDLSKVVAIASSGFFITLYFVFYKAPDLALTQILVEVITGMMAIILVFALKNKREEAHFYSRTAVSLIVAFAAAAITLSFESAAASKPLKEFFLESAVPLGNGMNVVNVILVDFRGFDTLGEATVLVIAAVAILGLSRNRFSLNWNSRLTLIPSIILQAITPYLFFVVNLFALYLLLRGHNQPGGGFIGGLACGIAMIMVGMQAQLSLVQSMIRLQLVYLPVIGFTFTLFVALVPLMRGYPLLTHAEAFIPTTLLFDCGIFLIVLGIAVIGVFSLRADALDRSRMHGS